MSNHIKTLDLTQMEFERLYDFAIAGEVCFGASYQDSMKKALAELQRCLGYKNYRIMAWDEDDRPF